MKYRLTVSFPNGDKPITRETSTASECVDKFFLAMEYYKEKNIPASLLMTDQSGHSLLKVEGSGTMRPEVKTLIDKFITYEDKI